MTTIECIDALIPLLKSGAVQKTEALSDDAHIKAYMVVNIIRIDILPRDK